MGNQFFWSETNTRSDRYGGTTLKERTRFAAEVISAVRNAVGPDFPIYNPIESVEGTGL